MGAWITGINIGDYKDYYRDPRPHSLLSTRKPNSSTNLRNIGFWLAGNEGIEKTRGTLMGHMWDYYGNKVGC